MARFQLTPLQQLAVVVVVVAAIAALASRTTGDASAPAAADADQSRHAAAFGALRLGVPAPRVSLLTRAGKAVPLDSYRGRVVFVNFWATWCGPCRAEMASMIALSRTLDPRDIAFVSIAEDDSWPPVDAYLRANPLPFDLYRDDPPRVEDQFATKSYPTSFLIDRDGVAAYRVNGARDWDTAEARALLASLGVRPVGR